MSKVIEETWGADDRSRMLSTLAEGHPHLLLIAVFNPEDPDSFSVKIDAGGGIENLEDVQGLLAKALDAVSPATPQAD